MLCKRENKQMRTEQTLLQAQMDKQTILINSYKRRISDNDELLKENKVNIRELNDKIRELETGMSQIRNEYEQENTALGVKLKNALHEMEETKADFDELNEENHQLKSNVNRLQNVIKITNEKSLELVQFIQNSTEIVA